MRYWILDINKKDEWKTFLDRFPEEKKDIYFSPEYCELSQLNGDGLAKCFCFEDNDVVGMYPFLLNEINGYDLDGKYFDIETPYGYGGPIINSEEMDDIKRFESCFLEYCSNNNIVAEFVRYHPIIQNHNIFNNGIVVEHNRYVVYLPVNGDFQYVWDNEISSKNRNMIRKAQNAAIEVKVMDLDSFNEFKYMYQDTMTRLNASDYYHFSEEYFNGLRKVISEYGTMLGAYLEEKLIACAVFFNYNNYFHYHLSCSDYQYRNLAPTNILLYRAIESAIEKKCKFVYFGGGITDSKEDTLFKFKKSFSKHDGDFYIGKRVHNNQVYSVLISEWESKNAKKAKMFLQYKMEG